MASKRNRSTKANQFRAEHKANWKAVNAPCGICGQATIDYDSPPYLPDAFELDHRKSIKRFPDLEFDPGNVQPSHFRCNRAKSSGDQVAGIGQTSEEW